MLDGGGRDGGYLVDATFKGNVQNSQKFVIRSAPVQPDVQRRDINFGAFGFQRTDQLTPERPESKLNSDISPT
ncbi:MAG: hypothetical protein ACU0DI_16025 [Paracoccaceae bacterium]